jgi:L-ascorbate metabolism protein UlaG (beta-lactamase superfamily)
MRRYFKIIFLIVAVLALSSAALAGYRSKHASTLDSYAHITSTVAPAKSGELHVTFFGVSTLLFEDGKNSILIDGFFTRPEKWDVFTSKISPNINIIEQSLQRANIQQLDAVIAAHSHYDHAMDSPEVARKTHATLYGSQSTANIGRGWGLPESQIHVVSYGDTVRIGDFEVAFLNAEHAPTGFTGGEIEVPLKPPVRASQYKEGQCFSMLISHKGKTILVQSSAGFAKSSLLGRHADVAFLGIGALGNQTSQFQEDYWNETVKATGAKRVIPIHWDDFTKPNNMPLTPIPWPFDDFDKSMAFLLNHGAKEQVEVKLLQPWIKIDPFTGM